MGGKADATAGAGSDEGRAYVNHIRFHLTLSEVKIDLGQVAAADAEPDVKGRFVTSPDYLLGMRNRVSRAIDLYQERFGTIAGAGMAGDVKAGGHG
jgi:hypothetical protein